MHGEFVPTINTNNINYYHIDSEYEYVRRHGACASLETSHTVAGGALYS